MTAHCEIVILAGGLSARMGCDKTQLRLGRRTLLSHVVRVAREVALPVRVIRRDAVPRCGPLGGVVTALRSTRRESVLFLSCDMPFVTADLLQNLRRRIRSSTTALFVASPEGVGFPFWLHRKVLGQVEEQLAQKEYSLQRLARRLAATTLRVPAKQLGELLNVNTPDDWAVARQRWRLKVNSHQDPRPSAYSSSARVSG